MVADVVKLPLTIHGCRAIILTMPGVPISKMCEFVIAEKLCDAVFEIAICDERGMGDPPTSYTIAMEAGLLFGPWMCNPYDSEYANEWFGFKKRSRINGKRTMERHICESLLAKLKRGGRIEEVQFNDGFDTGWIPTDEEIERRKKYDE